MEDHSNRTRLAKLLRFRSSNDPEKLTSLADYVSRMKDKQETIFFMAGSSLDEVKNSPFVERLLKKGKVCYIMMPGGRHNLNSLYLSNKSYIYLQVKLISSSCAVC